jgi:formate-dependent nitrite reductase membrane component NrfD
MLRVFKPQSAMSMGAWILAAFGTCVVPGLIALELQTFHLFVGAIDQILGVAAGILVFGSAIFGTLLATYTGVLIGATAIPAWFLHRRLLPIHFGTAGWGPLLRCWNCSATDSRRSTRSVFLRPRSKQYS